MARLAATSLAPHSKGPVDPNEFMLFPDEAHALPDDVEDQEKAWMMKLSRSG